MINIDKLNFKYGNLEVLKKIDINLARGDFTGIIGPNGSGKSTLLKNISRVLKPDSGTIYLDSTLLHEYNARQLARKMAVVPQDNVINFDFTVYDLIMMGRNPYQDRWGRLKEEDREIVNEAMELTDTKKLRNKSINQLSGGEKQRVIIARALAQKPDVLLLDEPTASLDINYQREIYTILSYLNNKLGITIIAVSHDLNLTSQYCDRIIFMNEGRIFATGTPAEVLTAGNIGAVYNTEVIVKENPLTGRPYVTIVPKTYHSEKKVTERDIRIHIICGGGTGKEIIEELNQRGYKLSCGVLNQGDADWEKAKKLNLELVEVPPFAPIDDRSARRNKKLMDEADLIIITPVPFGYGNLNNLREASEITEKNFIIYGNRDFAERDYTDGQAARYWQQITGGDNSCFVGKLEELLKVIENKET